jgi:hypothetical protein
MNINDSIDDEDEDQEEENEEMVRTSKNAKGDKTNKNSIGDKSTKNKSKPFFMTKKYTNIEQKSDKKNVAQSFFMNSK